MTDIPEATAEDKATLQEIEKEQKKYIETPRYKEWERLFLDKSNKETFGNATRSALVAYNLDESKQYSVASNIGHENVKKHENLARKYYEAQGKTPKEILDVFWNMMLAKKDVNMLYAIADKMGVQLPTYEPISSPQFALNVQNNIKEGGTTVYGQLTDEQLQQVIESKVRQVGAPGVIDGETAEDSLESAEIHTDSPEAVRG